MKTNKIGIIVTLPLTILSIFGCIFLKELWGNFSFAIFGSSLLAFIVCLINYFTESRRLVEEIVIDTYKINCCGFTDLFSTKKDLTLEKIIEVLDIIDDKYYIIYTKMVEFFSGLFKFDKRHKRVDQIMKKIYKRLIKIYCIESSIELHQDKLINRTDKIYADLEEFIDDDSLYLEIARMARKFNSHIVVPEGLIDKDKLKEECADDYLNSLNI